MAITEFTDVELDDEAFDAACEAATEAHVAGLDPCFQLEHGVQAYIFSLLESGWTIRPPGLFRRILMWWRS